MKNINRVLLINILIFAGFLLLPAFAFDIYKRLKLASQPPLPSEDLAINPAYPSIEEKEKAKQLSNDEEKGISYLSFIGWRRNPFEGTQKNVIPPYNNRLSILSSPTDSTWFFGGSTMWGTGAIDEETIPSWYAKKTQSLVFNLGESAWVSRQSLNQLVNLLGDGHKPKNIIFYSGVNDILHGCRSENQSVPSHSQEQFIIRKLDQGGADMIFTFFRPMFDFFAAPYKAAAGKFGFKISKHQNYGVMNCSTNPVKAQLIADHLVQNWYVAYLLSAAVGSDFMAVLQPQVFSTKYIDKSYLHTSDLYMSDEYKAVYPLIINKMKQYCNIDSIFCSKLVDGSSWLDGSDPVYIDFCHLTGQGNLIVADQIIKTQGL